MDGMDQTNFPLDRNVIIEELFGLNDDDSLMRGDSQDEESHEEEMEDQVDFGNDHLIVEEDEVHINVEAGPQPGMTFPSVNSLLYAYREHGKLKGFSVAKKSASKGNGTYYRYQTISCDRGRKTTHEKSSKRINCPAKISASFKNGAWQVTKRVDHHNHELQPDMSNLMPSQRNLTINMHRLLEANDIAGIRPCNSIRMLQVQAGGPNNIGCLPKDCRNFLEERRRLRLGDGDAAAIRSLFLNMQQKDREFFYMIDIDDEGRLTDVLWIHPRCRAAYEEFHDVVSFDTTYLVNRYKMPFATIVGINHHGQSILLGCALISHESIASFKWIFSTWLSAMGNVHPYAILTDQCESIKGAIREVMPNTVHRYCLWHILSKLPEKFRGVAQFKTATTEFKTLVYDCLTIQMFESKWNEFIIKYGMEDNLWLLKLYNERQNWAPVYLKHIFWAGMASTQRSEGMHAFFDGYVHSKSTLKQFVEQYEIAINAKIHKELMADFESKYKVIKCTTQFEWEQQFQEAYTHSMFKLVQQEIMCMLHCHIVPMTIEEARAEEYVAGVEKHKVFQRIIIQNFYHKQMEYVVEYIEDGQYLSCNCKKFEWKGIPCCHIFTVMSFKNIRFINERYIRTRWKKDVSRRHTKIFFLGGYPYMTEEYKRYKELERAFQDCSELCVDSTAKIDYVKQKLETLKNDLANWRDEVPATNINDDTTPIFDLVITRSRGRPPSNRYRGRNEVNRGRRGGSRGRRGRVVRGGRNQIHNEVSNEFLQPVVGTQQSQTNLNTNQAEMGEYNGIIDLTVDFENLVDYHGGSWIQG